MDEKRGFGYRSLFWPIVMIGVGVIWLLTNVGIVETSSLRTLVRMWPLILIVIGLDIIFGRRSPFLGALIGLGAVALVVALVILAPSLGIEPTGELRTLEYSEPIGEAVSARIDLDLERYPTTVDALTDSELLIDATLDTVTDVDFTVRGTQDKTVSIRPVSDDIFGWDWFDAMDAKWEIGLSAEVPLDLTVDIGSGSATLDLAELILTELEIDGGSGSTRLSLPAVDDEYAVQIDGGSGSFNIEIESGAAISAVVDVGSGSFSIEIGSGGDGEWRIDGGSGSLSFNVPDDVGVRVVVTDSGSGSVSVPSSYQLVDDRGDTDRDTGIWESDGYSGALHRIEIDFDPGSGSFNLR
jgi:hypothetical protein